MKMITYFLFQALLLIDSFADVVPSSLSASGNAYSLTVVDNQDPSNPIYELRRTNPTGLRSVLWRNIPDSRPKTPGLTIIALELSPIIASIEESNETSLLIFDGPADALVFRFPSDAKQASYVRIKYLRRGRDPVATLRFKHHGVLYFDTGERLAEKVIQFDEKGIITHDFRPPMEPSGRITSDGHGWKIVNEDPKDRSGQPPSVKDEALSLPSAGKTGSGFRLPPLEKTPAAPDGPSPPPPLQVPPQQKTSPDATSESTRPAAARDWWIFPAIGLGVIGLAAIWLRVRKAR